MKVVIICGRVNLGRLYVPCTYKRLSKWINGWVAGWMDGWMDGSGWMGGWIEKWMDGCMHACDGRKGGWVSITREK